MPAGQKTHEIRSKFQRYVKSNDKSLTEQYSLEELDSSQEKELRLNL
ncbi:hypothetical protein [Legionella israelensis]|nr:hypothetical protein [Legionella israelensis]